MMDVREIQDLINSPAPTPEEYVDVECSSCTGQWAADQGTSCFAPGEGIHAVTFKNYVGDDNVHVDSQGKVQYSCPNGCNYLGMDKMLHNIVEAGNPTPTDRWNVARLLHKQAQLERDLERVASELENYQGMYF